MKKLLTTALCVLLCALTALAQKPEEILAKTNQVMDGGEKDGTTMTMTMKIPLLGTFATKVYTLGNKSRTEVSAMGQEVTVWTADNTSWTYDGEKVTIETVPVDKSSDADEGLKMLDNTAAGYDLKVEKETKDSWYIVGTKKKSNTDKDAPKKIEITVAKESYILLELKTSLKGVTMTLSAFSFGGISDDFVTFDGAKYPDAKIVDKRK